MTNFSIWQLDFIRAVYALPKWRQRLLALVMGRYAWRELIGMFEEIEKEGYEPRRDYSCEDCSYHDDKIPRTLK